MFDGSHPHPQLTFAHYCALMDIQFLGTGAAEGIPPLFSRNEETRRVRNEQGPDLRTRSALKIGEAYQIDFGPDVFFQSIRCNCDFYELEHLLVTHMHSDHFQVEALVAKEMPYDTNGKPIHLYASRPGVRWLERHLESSFGPNPLTRKPLADHYPVTVLDYFQEYSIGELTVRTVRGNHRAMSEDEFPINPLIVLPNGKRLLYAVDTGYYDEESWEYLSDSQIDLLIMEATFGGRSDRGEYPAGHLDAYSFVRQVERMAALGVLDEQTPIFATHINPKHPWNHEQLQAFFHEQPFSIRVAYDCMTV